MKDQTKVKPKNVGKVAKVLIDNPNATYVDIHKKTGLAKPTISKVKKELNRNGTKDTTIAFIVSSSKDRIKRAQKILNRFIDESEEKEKLERGDIQLIKDVIKDDLARVTVLGGDATDDKGGLKDPTGVNIIVGLTNNNN